jgi:hypothetical protein
MFALGQMRTTNRGPKPTNVRFVPIADIPRGELRVITDEKQRDRLGHKAASKRDKGGDRGDGAGALGRKAIYCSSNALIVFVPLWLVSSWLVSSYLPLRLVCSYSAGPDVDHADSRQQRSRLRPDYQRGPRHPLR